jgi:hypothetical protein
MVNDGDHQLSRRSFVCGDEHSEHKKNQVVELTIGSFFVTCKIRFRQSIIMCVTLDRQLLVTGELTVRPMIGNKQNDNDVIDEGIMTCHES